MSLKSKILSILDVVLRVPPIFVMDTILINGFNDFTKSASQIVHNETSSSKHSFNISNKLLFDSDYEDIDILSISLNGASFGWIVLYLHCNISYLFIIIIEFIFHLGFLASFSMFLLPTRHLLKIYAWLTSIGVILWSYICNEEFNKYVFTIQNSSLVYEIISLNLSVITKFFGNYFLQV